MQIDHCLILAAGFGTRMGIIGQKLPKVLWPVFEKTLLELQVAYARSLGAKKIYINLHYMGEEIERHCKDKGHFEDVTFLWEKPEIFDIGGAIHNLASQKEVNYCGKLLVLNADQFFYLKPEDFQAFLVPFRNEPAVIFNYMVNSSDGYNGLDVDQERRVLRIIKNSELPKGASIETYTGISLIDLAQLKKVSGVSKFFESVCPLSSTGCKAILLENIDYWDFGTVKRYWDSMFRILETYRSHSNHPFLRFLINEKAIKSWKIGLQTMSYHARPTRVINLSNEDLNIDLGPSIILKKSKLKNNTLPTVWWEDLFEEVK